ncbi:relaxase/mobilization nuclease domain-containing protein [Butyrivibrio sp. INlla16]|uniref:relaxase/mobilization nuclease domain-containing protein n=1 Tax=Butyrivibrio sp. INlla16 TaxID=1520807 RepID=UPI000889F72D|nr:relaxase/mobilization nuclease domain-containing protein [Butyrivibrio sp. INlla16]SDB45693.1 Relaxase/Mobilisation nuclease domain-containing protein [Butyrivibrio sp. INlla16]
MAITKIHCIKGKVMKSVNYICNGKKTADEQYVTTYGCGRHTADLDFEMALSTAARSDRADSNSAYHIIQSFAPGEGTPEQIHQIGIDLMDRLFDGRYSYILATHLDHEFLHNHIIFCAVDNVDHHRYNDCRKTYYNLRNTSDELCRENSLSVIEPDQDKSKGLKYKEWMSRKNKNSWKDIIRMDIDSCIQTSTSYTEFITNMKAMDYEIKGDDLSGKTGKYISFRPENKDRFVRGSSRSLGSDYTREKITERIDAIVNSRTEQNTTAPVKEKAPGTIQSHGTMINISEKKFLESPGLTRWAKNQNLKTACSIMAAEGDPEAIRQKLTEERRLRDETCSKISDLEHEVHDLDDVIQYAGYYLDNLKYHRAYIKSKNKDAYERNHDSQLIYYTGGVNVLRKHGINPKDMTSEALAGLQYHREELSTKLSGLYRKYSTHKANISALDHDLKQLEKFMKPQSRDLFMKQCEARTKKRSHDLSL